MIPIDLHSVNRTDHAETLAETLGPTLEYRIEYFGRLQVHQPVKESK